MISILAKLRTVRIAFLTAILLLCAGVSAYSLGLLVHGERYDIYAEGVPLRLIGIQYVPNPAAAIPLLCAVLISLGAVTCHFRLAWVGLVVLTIFAGGFLLGMGGLLLPPAGALLLLVAFLRAITR